MVIWNITVSLPANANNNFYYLINGEIESLSNVGSYLTVDPTGELVQLTYANKYQ